MEELNDLDSRSLHAISIVQLEQTINFSVLLWSFTAILTGKLCDSFINNLN